MKAVPVLILGLSLLQAGSALSQTLIAASGDSNIAGLGVAPGDSYPAQLERWLRARGHDVRVLNTGVTGDTTAGLLARLDSAVPDGSQMAIISVGINDTRLPSYSALAAKANVDAIATRLRARGLVVFMFALCGADALPLGDIMEGTAGLKGPDGAHLSAQGYARVVARTGTKIEDQLP